MSRALWSLPAAVWLLGLVSFFNDFASDLIYPLMPLYLASVLMAGPRALGLIEGVAEAANSVLKLFSGVLVDRGRAAKPFVVWGYALAAVSRPLLAAAGSWPVVLGLRLVDRLGKGLRTSPRDAMLAAAVPAARRGLAFGVQRMLDNAGAVAGPLAAAALLAAGMSIRDIFLWAALPGAIAVATAAAVCEPRRSLPGVAGGFRWNLGELPAGFKRYLLVLALFSLGNSSNMFLLLRAKELGLPEHEVPLLWALTSASATLLSAPLAGLSDRIGRNRLILGGWAVYAVFYLVLGLSAARWPLWPLFALYGVFMAATEGAERALVADFVPQRLLGSAYGWFNLTLGLTLLPASVLFGSLWAGAGSAAAFAFAAGCAGAAAAALHTWVVPASRPR